MPLPLITSSSLVFSIADMKEVEKLVRSVQTDGLVWGACM